MPIPDPAPNALACASTTVLETTAPIGIDSIPPKSTMVGDDGRELLVLTAARIAKVDPVLRSGRQK